MRKTQIRNSLLLLLAATIWGSAFVAQSVGMKYIDPFTFTFSRSIIGGIVLLPCVFFISKGRIAREELLGGICCGVALFAASNFQQYGIVYTTPGKAGFITALYVVLVPILGIFLKRRATFQIWICVVLSVVGLYLLCMPKGKVTMSSGDLLVLVCAFLFSIHILVIDYFAPRGNGIAISCIQFWVCGVLSGIFMFLTEDPSIHAIWNAKGSILYAGVLSSGVAFTLQIVAQKEMNPTVASLICCLESVVAVLTDWLVLEHVLSGREIWGCVLMFGAIVLAQIPMPIKKKVRI